MRQTKSYTLSSIFNILSQNDLQFLQSHTNFIKLKRGQVLFRAGDNAHTLYAVAHGFFKSTYHTQDGQVITKRIIIPGELIGFRELCSTSAHHHTCTTLEDGGVFAINKAAILTLIKTKPEIGLHFISLFSNELIRMETMFEAFLTKSAKQKLAMLLLDFYQKFKPTHSNSFASPLQRKDIAELIGLTPETVSRVLRDLKHEKVLELQGKFFTVLDVEALKNYGH